jgi:hypothetical protein
MAAAGGILFRQHDACTPATVGAGGGLVCWTRVLLRGRTVRLVSFALGFLKDRDAKH